MQSIAMGNKKLKKRKSKLKRAARRKTWSFGDFKRAVSWKNGSNNCR